MATITSATGGMVNPASADLQSTINSLLTSVNTGEVVTADQINSIVSLYNSFIGHVHSVSDLYGIFNYGDGLGTPYSSSGNYEYKNTGTAADYYYWDANGFYVAAGFSTLNGVSSGDTITAVKHNELANTINGVQGHFHEWNDRTG